MGQDIQHFGIMGKLPAQACAGNPAGHPAAAAVVAQRTPSRPTLFCSSLSAMCADFISRGNASAQWPLSASVAACSAAAGVTAAVLLETCAMAEKPKAHAKQIEGPSLDNVRDITYQ